MTFEEALVLARLLISSANQSPEEAAGNSVIPKELQEEIIKKLKEEETVELSPVKAIVQNIDEEWLSSEDRQNWYYWPRLRSYLLGKQNWTIDRTRSLDNSTDKVLELLSHPDVDSFAKRGLVLGYVQSGKTANYTALISKAADVGYRLFIVLAGMDNGLRRQTQLRLQKELVGYPDNNKDAIEYPEQGKRWLVFTSDEMVGGDFDAGHVDVDAVLHGTQPALMVVKKNFHVLGHLLKWLEGASSDVRSLPFLLVDDEADQASIDTRGSPQGEDYIKPSVINGQIRDLLNGFTRKAYVAYTATPFANVLIPYDSYDPNVGNDLYPKDFIIDLPKPKDYVGTEDLFGKSAFEGYEEDEDGKEDGLDVIRIIEEEPDFNAGIDEIPRSLRDAILDFILAGAAKMTREQENKPSTMLIHVSHLVAEQNVLFSSIKKQFEEIRDEWRYFSTEGIEKNLRSRWEENFCFVPEKDIPFDDLKNSIGKFCQQVKFRLLNSGSEDTLDYENSPGLKAIVVGGNKLSRGLTLEGLLVSYFSRNSNYYDTLMQMGRWFGFRRGYEDLTRIYTTRELADKFSHLSQVEYQFRQDLALYERDSVTPDQVGPRVLAHPQMLVTSPLKQRYASEFMISYSFYLFQTFKFPFNQPEELAFLCEKNRQSVITLLTLLGPVSEEGVYPVWHDIESTTIRDFLNRFDNGEHEAEIEGIRQYIGKCNGQQELIRWTVAIRQRGSRNEKLSVADWEVIHPNQMLRSRLKGSNSLGVITNPGDEMIGLSDEDKEKVEQLLRSGAIKDKNRAARTIRSPEEGLLLLYPISRHSAPEENNKGSRESIFDNPDGPLSRDLIGLAISFPKSRKTEPETYIQGTPGWKR